MGDTVHDAFAVKEKDDTFGTLLGTIFGEAENVVSKYGGKVGDKLADKWIEDQLIGKADKNESVSAPSNMTGYPVIAGTTIPTSGYWTANLDVFGVPVNKGLLLGFGGLLAVAMVAKILR